MKKLVEWSVNRPALANILMVFLLAGGGWLAVGSQREVLPEFSLDRIMVSVVYKGASAEEIEESICVKIEEEVAGVEGVKKITSEARENLGTVTVELRDGADIQKALDDVKNEVDQIDTFPDDAETPVIVELKQTRSVIKVSVLGDVSEKVLTSEAERVRDDLLRLPGISQVDLAGDREHEILIEVSEATLRKFGLTLQQIAGIIQRNSLDLPGGTLEGKSGKILVRTKGRLYEADQFEQIQILTDEQGRVRRLGEIAEITETFEDIDLQPRMEGKPAIIVNVGKTSEEDALEIADNVKAYVKKQNKLLPPGIRLAVWADDSIVIRSRLELLTTNALQGLALVFVILSLFLRLRLAFWVALGIPISILGSFVFLEPTDFTLNMITMFSFIVVLGVVVDDAIVIGENVYSKASSGVPPVRAAVDGTVELAYPVINAVATTIVAFAPMLFVAGTMGKLMHVFPVAIIAVLLVSLFEVFIILPSHLAHMKASEDLTRRWSVFSVAERIRGWFDVRLHRFIDGPYTSTVETVMRYRYVFCAAVIAVWVLSIGLVASGRVLFVIFPKMDSDTLSAKIQFPEGTSFATTLRAIDTLEKSAAALNDRFPTKEDKPIVEYIVSLAGQELVGNEQGSHTADVIVQLLPSEERGIPSAELAAAWRDTVGGIADAQALTFSTELPGAPRPGGEPIEIHLLGDDPKALRTASALLRQKLATFEGVQDIQDSYRPSKPEMRLALNEEARQLGITLSDLASQVRANLWGVEALVIQRGRNEVTVRVRYPERGKAEPGDLERMKILTPDGRELPFLQAARVTRYRGASVVNRIHRQRAVTVTADVDEQRANADMIVARLSQSILKEIPNNIPGVSVLVEGQKKEAAQSLGSLVKGFIVAVLLIYVLLVNQFRTYTTPLVVMAAIPFSIIGVIVGHIIFGMSLTLFSMFGVLALAGIVVNDSLLLVHTMSAEIERGKSLQEALSIAGRSRFRQIILTSLSTMAGLTPILAETSFQAQFLKPMTVAVVFGLLFATFLILLFVPALMVIRDDILNALHTHNKRIET